MVLPTIATSIIIHSMLDHDYIPLENEECVRGETTKMSTADFNSVATPLVPTLTWDSQPTCEYLHKQHMGTTSSIGTNVKRMVRKYHTPDWIIHYDLAPGVHLAYRPKFGRLKQL